MDQTNEKDHPDTRLEVQRQPHGDGLHDEVLHPCRRWSIKRHENIRLTQVGQALACRFSSAITLAANPCRKQISARSIANIREMCNSLQEINFSSPSRQNYVPSGHTLGETVPTFFHCLDLPPSRNGPTFALGSPRRGKRRNCAN
jgi:hypothetical protein